MPFVRQGWPPSQGGRMEQLVEIPRSDAKSYVSISRRMLLEGGICGSLAGVGSSWSRDANAGIPEPASGWPARQAAAYSVRQAAAQAYLFEQQSAHRSNDDESRYPDKRASFAKTLPHNDFGEVDPNAFGSFVAALSSGNPRSFESVPRDPRAEVGLNDP